MLQHTLPILVIPAFNPDQMLTRLLQEHGKAGLDQPVIIVNDGSHPASSSIFSELEIAGYTVLHHDKNLGKGAALKTAMTYYLAHYSACTPGIVTADADGQHALGDIIRLSEALLEKPYHLHLGVRQISRADIPLRSRFGNLVTRFLFNWFTGNNVKDTQTGLRAIPVDLIRHLILASTSRYEFEFEMFFIAKTHHVKIGQIPIKTIYIDNNKGSHFNPFCDSLRIYFVFIRFCCVGLASFLLDFSLFVLLYHYSANPGLSVLGSRLVSVPFNFLLNKNISFQYKGKLIRPALLYAVLALVIGLSSLTLMNLLHYAGLSIYSSKIIAELLIFIANFIIQYVWVFTKQIRLVSVGHG